MIRKAPLRLALALLTATVAESSSAADLGSGASGGIDAGRVVAAPVQPYWYGGGRRWHGHHDWAWGSDPHHVYATFGWKQPWNYAPRTLPYQPYRARATIPVPAPRKIYRTTPPAWTAQ